jgi:lysophospholipase L1-like esterase
LPPGPVREVTLNFPLYQGVKQVEIGLAPNAQLFSPLPWRTDRRVIVYGTSITQGGCANRPGMSYPNILSRRLNAEVINLGFSGNGRAEPELAHLIAEITNPGLYIIDCEANVPDEDPLAELLDDFVRILRDTQPTVPILLLSSIRFAYEVLEDGTDVAAAARERKSHRREIHRALVDRRRTDGDRAVFFQDGAELLGDDDYEECTVDGVHPTDLGFLRMAKSLEPVCERLLFKREA